MNNITKIGIKAFSVALLILLLATASAAATIVSLADVVVEPDGVVTIPIMIGNITNYGAGTINIWYDPSVVHVTDVTGSPDSNVVAKDINNTAGFAKILASNLGGVSGDIIFANIEFMAVGPGSTPLNIDVIELCDTSYNDISANISDGSITVEASQPAKPFFIYGYVCYKNGTPCNNPTVNITNSNTYEEWQTETGGSSNYYQITLTSGSDLNVNDVLRFDATDGTKTNVTDHTVTADEMNAGGLFGFNLTLESIDPAPSLVTYTISNTTIAPNGDGIKDDTEIDVKFSEPVDAAIKIENASGVVKSLYASSSKVTDLTPKIWDGTDDGGNIVAGGTYYVNITMDDGVNPLVHDNSRLITVMVGTITSVSIADIIVEPGDTVVVPLMINDMTDYGTGTINITYDPSVVHVTDVTSSPDSTVYAFNNNNVAGFTKISALNTDGASGDIVFANVEFTAVGSSGDSTLLNLDVISLYDRSYNTIPTIVDSGSFTIQSSADPKPSLVTYTISNSTISPNGDGIMDDTEIDVEFSESVDAAILIENATGIIRTLYTGSYVTDPDPEIWNGTDNDGDLVADGTYYVNITMDDGVNPLVYNNTRSISVTKGTIVSVFITDVTVATGDTVTLPIRIDGIIDYGTGTTNLTYNSTVVHVTDVTSSPDSTVTIENIDNTTGLVRISARNITGVSGDIVFANVIFTAVGIGTTPLNLTVDTLQDIAGLEIPVTIDNGSITVDTTPPASITNLDNTTYQETYINWTWTDPADTDFSKVMVYLDESFKANVSEGIQFYNATELAPDTEHEIATRTVDNAGNINATWVNHTSKTAPDVTVPVINTVTLNTTTPNTGDAILVTVNATDYVGVTNVTADSVELTSQGGNIWNGTIIAIEGTHFVNVSAEDEAGNTGWNNSTGYTATTPDTTAPANGSITGKVTDSVTKLIIEGATVTADGATAQTKSAGGYTISLKAGTYTVNASKAGYIGQTRNVVVEAGLSKTENFALVRDYVELELEAGETTTKVGNVNEDILFNLTVTNHGNPAEYSISNLSTTANVVIDIDPTTTGLLNDSNPSASILVKINASINGSYPVTISAIADSKSAAITIVALVLNRSAPGTNDSSSDVDDASELLNGTLVQNGSTVNESTVTSSVVDNSTVLGVNVTDSLVSEGSNVTGGKVESSTVTNTTTTGTEVEGSTVTGSTATGGKIEGSIVTDTTTADTTVEGSTLVDVTATNCKIEEVTLQNIELENATVTKVDGKATIKGGTAAKVNTSGDGGVKVHFENVYKATAVEDLIKNQTTPQPVQSNVPVNTTPAEAAKVRASLSLNSSVGGNVTISRCGINPGGSAFVMTGFGGMEGDYIHISHPDIPDGTPMNVTLELFYHAISEPGTANQIAWFNGSAGTDGEWVMLNTGKVYKQGIGWFLSVTIDHLSTFALVTSTTPPAPSRRGGGGGGSTYPPGWFATPTVTATAVPGVTPTVTQPEEAVTTPTKPAVAEKTPAAEEAPTPEQVMEFRAEPPSLPPPILSPTAGIVIVAVAAIFGIVMVTRTTEDARKATIATIGIVVVAVAAIIGMLLV